MDGAFKVLANHDPVEKHECEFCKRDLETNFEPKSSKDWQKPNARRMQIETNPIKAKSNGHSGIQMEVWHAHHFIFFLHELDKVCIFVNGLDNHIKFMVNAYSPKIPYKTYRGPFTVVVLKNGQMISLVFTNNNYTRKIYAMFFEWFELR